LTVYEGRTENRIKPTGRFGPRPEFREEGGKKRMKLMWSALAVGLLVATAIAPHAPAILGRRW
jgi:hypothetical protein